MKGRPDRGPRRLPLAPALTFVAAMACSPGASNAPTADGTPTSDAPTEDLSALSTGALLQELAWDRNGIKYPGEDAAPEDQDEYLAEIAHIRELLQGRYADMLTEHVRRAAQLLGGRPTNTTISYHSLENPLDDLSLSIALRKKWDNDLTIVTTRAEVALPFEERIDQDDDEYEQPYLQYSATFAFHQSASAEPQLMHFVRGFSASDLINFDEESRVSDYNDSMIWLTQTDDLDFQPPNWATPVGTTLLSAEESLPLSDDLQELEDQMVRLLGTFTSDRLALKAEIDLAKDTANAYLEEHRDEVETALNRAMQQHRGALARFYRDKGNISKACQRVEMPKHETLTSGPLSIRPYLHGRGAFKHGSGYLRKYTTPGLAWSTSVDDMDLQVDTLVGADPDDIHGDYDLSYVTTIADESRGIQVKANLTYETGDPDGIGVPIVARYFASESVDCPR